MGGSPLFGEDSHFDFFQTGWNHQLDTWKAKCPIFKATVPGSRGKVASKNRAQKAFQVISQIFFIFSFTSITLCISKVPLNAAFLSAGLVSYYMTSVGASQAENGKRWRRRRCGSGALLGDLIEIATSDADMDKQYYPTICFQVTSWG